MTTKDVIKKEIRIHLALYEIRLLKQIIRNMKYPNVTIAGQIQNLQYDVGLAEERLAKLRA